MRRKKGKLMITAALLCFLAIGVTYAAIENTISFVEKFETGKVGMTLHQLAVTEKGEVEAAPDIVEANKDVSYIPRFTSTGAGCYIRAKVDIIMAGSCSQPLGTECIYGLSEDWVQQGEYFYCMKPLTQGEQSDLFKGIHIPADWDPGSAKGFSVMVTAEAIQSSNFDPDFGKPLPWGAVMLNDIAAGAVCYKAADPVSEVSKLNYTSEGGFECSTSDLFDEFSKLMPGDKCEKEIKVQNDSGCKLRMYLKVSSGNDLLTDKMTLKLSDGEEILYYGRMSEVCKNESFKLADINEGGVQDLKFEMGIPVDAGNEYSETAGDMVWTLTAEKLPDKIVRTDDTSNLLPYVICAVVAALAASGLIFFRRKETE